MKIFLINKIKISNCDGGKIDAIASESSAHVVFASTNKEIVRNKLNDFFIDEVENLRSYICDYDDDYEDVNEENYGLPDDGYNEVVKEDDYCSLSWWNDEAEGEIIVYQIEETEVE